MRAAGAAAPGTWLVSARFDLLAFVAPALVALALVPFADTLAPADVSPLWAWVAFVLCVDVAHVWSTIFRTYLDRAELSRRPRLYIGAPIVAYGIGLGLALVSFDVFWRGMAYLAVFHFIRQQYGWVRLYQRKEGCTSGLDRHLDVAAVYAATGFPVLWWHANLPRRFDWFVPGDFVAGLSEDAVRGLWPVYGLILLAFFARQVHRAASEGFMPWGKTAVVATTAACWGIGIIATNSDWAFTVTNVIIHGVPYVAFIWISGRAARASYPAGSWNAAIFRGGKWLYFALILLTLAYVEEFLWDRTLWLDRGAIFPGPDLTVAESWVPYWMPLLALPQVTHYILDGFIWRRRAGAEERPERGTYP